MSVARTGINIGFVDRPLFLGLIWAVVTGDYVTPLFLAVFYELFWLDLFRAGTYIPPNSLFPMLTVLAFLDTGFPADAPVLLPLVVLTLPLAALGAGIEKFHRNRQAGGYNRVLKAFRAGRHVGAAAASTVHLSIVQFFVCSFLAFFTATWALVGLYGLYGRLLGGPIALPHASWPLIWSLGAVGGILSLRIRRSLALFLAGSVVLGVLAFLGIPL